MTALRPFFLLLVAALFCLPGSDAEAQPKDRPSSLLDMSAKEEFDTDGYMVGGDYWNTVKPLNSADGKLGSLGSVKQAMLLGSTDGLRNPNGLWPSGYRYTQTFRGAHAITFPVFDTDGWPGYGPGNSIYGADGTQDTGGQNGTSRYMFAAFNENVAGADDPSRNYTRSARYTDKTRTHLVYEAGFPTTAGIDVRIRAHQFTVNEDNLNDFVVMEVTLENTGKPDTDADGEVDATGNVVDGFAMDVSTSPTPSIRISDNGSRNGNGFGGGRNFGYVATKDDNGAPYNLFTYFKGLNLDGQPSPGEGERAFGVNFFGAREGYTDIWNGWEYLGVKQGGIPATDTRSASSYPSSITASSPDKQTVFGTHPIGEGARKGWYTSSQWRSELGSASASDIGFWNATATWYEDYGKTTSSRSGVDLSPNSSFFSGSGTEADFTTWTVANPNARPDGDFKYASEADIATPAFAEPVFEEQWNPQASNGNFYGGTGFMRNYPFSGSPGQGIGPFQLKVGEEITVVFVSAAGYRLDGIIDATDAAEWAWERGWDIRQDLPVPAAPDMNVESTANQSARISWTDVSNLGNATVDGYKIWRAAQFERTDYLDEGMRLMDRYHHQHTVDADLAQFKDPVNQFFSPPSGFFSGAAQGSYQPAEWGDYELIQKIPAGQLEQFQAQDGSFDYAFEDTEAITGFTYWYYVSAYSEGDFTGPQGPVEVGHIESSNMNRNGRNAPDAGPGEIGLSSQWQGTYPFAFQNANYPAEGTTERQNIGASFTLVPPTSPVDSVAQNITVTPNPYKKTALNDVRNDPSSHNVTFLNLPEDFRLTILDVTGQIIFQKTVEGARDGQFKWNLFSKDGVEVASGLYIYHVQYGENFGRETTGYLSILR
ncbi:MAG: hypothetical protein ABEL51_04090 [Salinibacter sp.]